MRGVWNRKNKTKGGKVIVYGGMPVIVYTKQYSGVVRICKMDNYINHNICMCMCVHVELKVRLCLVN